MKRIIVIILSAFSCFALNAQNIDTPTNESLYAQFVDNGKSKDENIKAVEAIIDSFFYEINFMGSYPYIDVFNKLTENTDNQYYIALSEYFDGKSHKDNYGSLKLKEALNRTESLPNSSEKYLLQIKIYLALGVNLSLPSSEAYKEIQKGLELNQKYGNKMLEDMLNFNMAFAYKVCKLYHESNQIYRKLLYETPSLKVKKYYIINNMALNYISMLQPDSALILLDDIFNYELTKEEISETYTNISSALLLKKDYTKAKEYSRKGILTASIDDYSMYLRNATCYINLAEAYNAESEYDMAIKMIDSCLYLARQIKSHQILYCALEMKINILENINDFKNAFICIKEMNTIKDTLNRIRDVAEISRIKMEQEFKMKENEYVQRQIIAKLENTKKMIILALIIIVLTATVVVIVLLLNKKSILLKNKQMKEKLLAQDLEMSNRELTSNMMILMKKNEMLSDINERLLIIQKGADKDVTKTAISMIMKEINKIIEGKLLEEFETYYKLSNSEFYDRLTKNYPNLTNNETRLCCLMRLNLTSKDISSLTGQRVETIIKARHRLRIKFGIHNDRSINLSTFILQI